MKKTIALLLLVLILSVCTVPTFAATSATGFLAADNSDMVFVPLGREGIRVYVYGLYTYAMDRQCTSSEYSYWESEMFMEMRSAANVAHYFFTSPEYIARDRTNALFLSDIYRALLGRDIDSSGLAYWTGRLINGSTRGQIVIDLCNQSEFKERCRELGIS